MTRSLRRHSSLFTSSSQHVDNCINSFILNTLLDLKQLDTCLFCLSAPYFFPLAFIIGSILCIVLLRGVWRLALHVKISHKVGTENARLADINERLDFAQRGIASITGQSSRATTVFSTAKYPAPKELPNYERLHVGAHALELPKPYADAQEGESYALADPKLSSLSASHQSQEVLELFQRVNAHSSSGSGGGGHLDPAFTMEREGLGRVPASATSCGSLLLYNSAQTPYQSYSATFDNLAEALGAKEKDEEKAVELAAQPQSVASGILLPDVADFNYE